MMSELPPTKPPASQSPTPIRPPQFGLRLMLLVVALIAAIVGWLTAEGRFARLQNGTELMNLQSWLARYESADKNEVDQVRKMTTEPTNWESDIYYTIHRIEEIKSGNGGPEREYLPLLEPPTRPHQ
jgi:hypothetical protein